MLRKRGIIRISQRDIGNTVNVRDRKWKRNDNRTNVLLYKIANGFKGLSNWSVTPRPADE